MGFWVFRTYPVLQSVHSTKCLGIFPLVFLNVFFPVYVAASLAHLHSPRLVLLWSNASMQFFCHKILNIINTRQRQQPNWKPGLGCEARMENLPERKAGTRDIYLLLYYTPTPLTHKQWDTHLTWLFGSRPAAHVTSESTRGHCLKKAYLEICLQICGEVGKMVWRVPIHPSPGLPSVNILLNRDAFVRTKKSTLLWSKLQILFVFHQFFHLCPFSIFSVVGWCGVCGRERAN